MRTSFGKPSPPSEDRRWKIIGATMRRHGYQPHALIETLHTVQESFGFVGEDAFHYVADSLRIPLSHVYGVATFYHFFNLKPQGEHTCVVCTGTACYIKGASLILQAIEDEYGIKPGETSDDGKLSVLTARCIGACGIAPAVVFDGEIVGGVSATDAVNRIRRCLQK
ncbi:MAG: bidirectional hydrogenase complex protein HoxE [Candidatus Omnitrophota bacterium]|jgi:bidirectional [NiFe] hydrogenase diaphorase subunit|nr:MAG: bidirectional hydrogenase complex protein HoxE [Candidatus Omnitrophota bacterium]